MWSNKDIVSVPIEDKTVPVETHFFGNLHARHELILSPGFSVPGKYFSKVSESLTKRFENDFLVIVPEIIGKSIKGYDNDTYKRCSDLYSRFVEQFANVSAEASLSATYQAQHSSGPISASDKVIMINPLMPGDHSVSRFLWKGVFPGIKEEFQFIYGSGYGLDYTTEFLSNIRNNIKVLQDLSRLDSLERFQENQQADLLLLYSGTDDKDQFSDYSTADDLLNNKFKSYTKVSIPSAGHHGILYKPDLFASEIEKFIR